MEFETAFRVAKNFGRQRIRLPLSRQLN
jgi:hypothetical protein